MQEHHKVCLKKAEVRRQKAEGSFQMGIQPHLKGGNAEVVGVLDPCSLRSRAAMLKPEFPSAFSIAALCLS
ncbi:MAG: hypothetical protein DSM106950_17150 [Stigonema ocellatum SAG 48.90 = DSM 106950]|nr:hypothetical protein [Stigonema ocellatum SAG 48.90 = DSM 106950]